MANNYSEMVLDKDYIKCELCGYPGKNITEHIRASHKLTKFEYETQFKKKTFVNNVNGVRYKPKYGYLPSKPQRSKDTAIEAKIQYFLNFLQIEFVKHRKMVQLEHPYVCDIFVPSMNLVIECDGNHWHNYPHGTETDKQRTQELIQTGFQVLRLWESEIRVMNLDEFKTRLDKISKVEGLK